MVKMWIERHDVFKRRNRWNADLQLGVHTPIW
jgi:hypothetical protein